MVATPCAVEAARGWPPIVSLESEEGMATPVPPYQKADDGPPPPRSEEVERPSREIKDDNKKEKEYE